MQMHWMGTLSTVGGVLTLLAVLVGLVTSIIAYVRGGRSRVALLGALGFFLMFLLSCCSVGWAFTEQPVMRRFTPRVGANYYAIRSTVLFLLGLVNLGGLALIISAIWTGGRKE
ncbi:MAG: hypothetical protein JXA09_05815 [Anaerolineae bacterium]|nr:hypothetical protein [Anaerolineae bacterium]